METLDVETNEAHPAYAQDMELLCFLSPVPQRLADIALDLGVHIREARVLVDKLRGRGFAVMRGTGARHPLLGSNADARQKVWVDPAGWKQAETAAQAYWALVYSPSCCG